jgi:hypothetical protein
MEQKSNNKTFAKGIYLTKKKSKANNDYFELSIKNGDTYDKYICYEGKPDKFNNIQYNVFVKEQTTKPKQEENLPF